MGLKKSTFSSAPSKGAARLRCLWALVCGLLPLQTQAQESICARVKIEIKQELTLERQAFDAEMKINNALDDASLTDVSVIVKVTDEQGVAVPISSDPNNQTAKFFVSVFNMQNIADVDGSGTVAPATTATINWLLIPSTTAAEDNPFGKKYLVGATLQYKFGAETHTLDVSPDVITVKPLPKLTLDYFLTKDVIGDDPFSEPVEQPEPFTLGVRIKNTGMATAKTLKIDSAQPKITENQQGLLVNFRLTGSYIDDAPVQNTLLIDFGDVLPSTAKMGRWLMESSLTGTFTEFTARFTHADELGGALTSILQATNAHLLLRDVRVDVPGRDYIRDFLARDVVGGTITVYESDGADTVVTDQSATATLTAGQGNTYVLSMPATAGFVYARLPDPYGGAKALGTVVRSDAKAMLPENVWLSRNKNLNTNNWEYWVNVFDANTSGSYSTEFVQPVGAPLPPVIQYVPDRVLTEGDSLSVVVEASSPDDKALTLSAAPIPNGAVFTTATDSEGITRGTLSWTPQTGEAGEYRIVYTARDGTLTTARSAKIVVEMRPNPGAPTLLSPAPGATLTVTQPDLVVHTPVAADDPTASVEFELYSDRAMTQRVAFGVVPRGTTIGASGTTSFAPGTLTDNTTYWWRARGYDGTQIRSSWASGWFRVNRANEAPRGFNLASPAADMQVTSLQPTLYWMNTTDRDGDDVTYSVYVYLLNTGVGDNVPNQLVASVEGLAPGSDGTTNWTVSAALTNLARYQWKVVARDQHGARATTGLRAFIVNTVNAAPSTPGIAAPAPSSVVASGAVALTVANSTDSDGDPMTYVFEIDTVPTFDSGSKQASAPIAQSGGGNTQWTATAPGENRRYWWRVKAQDGKAESAWASASFLKSATNDAPAVPVPVNPGQDSWAGTQTPTLQVVASEDPEGEAVAYDFEIYNGSTRTAAGASNDPLWVVSAVLPDQTIYTWRARARDASGAASAWSNYANVYIATGNYQPPSIQLWAPSEPVQAQVSGATKTLTIRWAGTDPNAPATVALYYSSLPDGSSPILIVNNLQQASGSHEGSYVWDVTGLASGPYYVLAVIADGTSTQQGSAPGSLVVPNSPQQGQIVVTAASNLRTTEKPGSVVSFTVNLGNAPTSPVTVPLYSTEPFEGAVSPAALFFGPDNWSTARTVTVTGVDDCVLDGSRAYQVLVGGAISADPNYVGISGTPVALTNEDDALDAVGTTQDGTRFGVCGYSVVSRTVVGNDLEYELKAQLTNLGSPALGFYAALRQRPATAGGPEVVVVLEDSLAFGAAARDETVGSADSFKVRLSGAGATGGDGTTDALLFNYLQAGYYWDVTPQ